VFREILTVGIVLTALFVSPGANSAGQAGPSGTLSFLSAQADRGLRLYANQCASCHGVSLQGGSGPALTGIPLRSRWTNRSVREFEYVLTTQMPLNAPGSLSESDYFDLLAFILLENDYPFGTKTLDSSQMHVLLFDDTTAPAAADSNALAPKLPDRPEFYGRAEHATPDDAELLRADDAHWLMYNKDYQAQRYSGLRQINTRSASRLRAVCAFQLGQVGWYQASPVIYDGTLYITAGGSTYAIDAATCRKRWQHHYVTAEHAPIISVNRGIALYRGAVYRTTPTGHLIALDAGSGKLLWDVRVSSTASGHWLAAAPIAFDGKIFAGEAGADAGANGHVYAFDSATGALIWTFDLVPTGSQTGADTWQQGGATGGGSTWTSYSLDPAARALYVPVGNPAPDYAGEGRPGNNLFSNSVLALDVDTGRLIWYAQQLPHDVHDWDTAAPAALYAMAGRRYVSVATKGGWLYLYDRDSHRLLAQEEVSSHLNIDVTPTAAGVRTCPGTLGGVEWFGPAFSPVDGALFVNSVEWCGKYLRSEPSYTPGSLYLGGTVILDPAAQAKGWIRGFDAATGRPRWAVQMSTPMLAGLTATAGEVLFTGDLNGDFLALRASSGKVLYRFNTGGSIAGGISTYLVGGKQYAAVASGNASRVTWGSMGAASIFIFALP
jgi:PQQ-dependent dehydrogenase (methanol/ethanol family)